MSRNSAWKLFLTLICLWAGVVGCVSDSSRRSTRDSTTWSEAGNAVSSGSCH